MLNKNICKKCVKESNVAWCESKNEGWFCRQMLNRKRKFIWHSDEVPEYCPYKMEQIILNGENKNEMLCSM